MAKGLQMSKEMMAEFIDNVGRTELYDEMKNIKIYSMSNKYPPYLKAVRVTLIELGYDPDWVDGPFRDALEDKYLGSH